MLPSHRLAKELQEVGASAIAYPADGKTHDNINNDLGPPDGKPEKAMFEFLDGVLKV